MLKLRRLSNHPILSPDPQHPWEASAVFNCGAIYDDGQVHLIYRATDTSPNGKDGVYINAFGYAASRDGMHFDRLERPILLNDVPQEARGPEDPRIVKLGDTFYMLYTGYGGRFDGDWRICLAASQNLRDWTRHGVLLDEPNKDASLFPEKINGRYVMLHRRPPNIWITTSTDLQTWENHQILMKPRPASSWESEKIGIAGPPIKTPDGWLLIYHGVCPGPRYSLGAALLDLQDPTQVIARQTDPILEPELPWEVHGYVPNVVFSCGQAQIGDDLYVYYGGADTVIGVAALSLRDLKFD